MSTRSELLDVACRPHTGRSGPRGRVEPETWRDAREWAGQTQTQAAEAVGVSLRCWQRWEGGERRGPWHALRAYVAVVEDTRATRGPLEIRPAEAYFSEPEPDEPDAARPQLYRDIAVMSTDALPTDDSDMTRFD